MDDQTIPAIIRMMLHSELAGPTMNAIRVSRAGGSLPRASSTTKKLTTEKLTALLRLPAVAIIFAVHVRLSSSDILPLLVLINLGFGDVADPQNPVCQNVHTLYEIPYPPDDNRRPNRPKDKGLNERHDIEELQLF